MMLVCRVCVRSKFQESSKKDGGGERWTSPRWRRCPTSLFVLLFFFFLFFSHFLSLKENETSAPGNG